MPRCANKSCKQKLPKGALPRVCDDACRGAAIAQVLQKKREADKRAAARAANLVEREAKEQRREFRRKRVEFKLNDIGLQKDYTQSAVNKLCLLLDKGRPCISCGRPDDGQPRKRNASHYKSRGANSALRFDLRNLHASCVVCNLYQSGNVVGYKAGLLERLGATVVDHLDSAPRIKEWECAELIAMRKEFNAEIRRLEQGLPPSKDWRALPKQEEQAA